MNAIIFRGLLIPFLGTSLGSACVFFMKKDLDAKVQKALTGFAAGVMLAASIWSLIIPAIDQSVGMGKWAFAPAVVGFCLGMLFLLLLDKITPHMHMNNVVEGPRSNLQKTTMMVLAVTLHNIPEGMAVGVVYAGWASGNTGITVMGALSLALGIAIQNFPEGAIISMPLHSNGLSKKKSCWYGILSGIVEPVAGLITVLLAHYIVPVLPYLLGFAAGAMIYVVVEELIPEMSEGEHNNITTIIFMLGFSLMLALDVAMG
jgi:ZIP family zinc transporter